MLHVLSLKEQWQSSRHLSSHSSPGIIFQRERYQLCPAGTTAAAFGFTGEMPDFPPALPVSQCCCSEGRERRWHRGDNAGTGTNGVFLSLIWLKGNQLGRNGDVSDEYACTCVWLCAGTAAACLLMPLWCSCDWRSSYSNQDYENKKSKHWINQPKGKTNKQKINNRETPNKPTNNPNKKPKPTKTTSVLDGLLSQQGLFVMNTCKVLLNWCH